jgi:predicted acyl esterase
MVSLVAAVDGEQISPDDLPYAFSVTPHVAIPLSDGTTLSAHLWLPDVAMREPVPAVVEYAPFRHRDVTAPRDALIGMSWGGFSALQVAARQPPSLACIIAVHATDDRFADDVHYMGGCPRYNNLSWGALLFGYMARPPDPLVFGEDWRDEWLSRVDNMPFALAVCRT